jgi:VWFA-related protein
MIPAMLAGTNAPRWVRTPLLVCVTCAMLSAAGRVQQKQTALALDSTVQIKARVELVNVDVAVTDARGNFVRNLKRENFRILDEGAEQPITHFAPVEAPAVVLVLVETSPAVYLIHRQHLEAAQALLDGLAADDWVGLGTYDQSARLRLGLTQDKRALHGAMLDLQYGLGMGQLNLFDGVSAALGWLAGVPSKKAIVLLSTGLDTSAAARWESLLDELRANEVALFPVGLGGELRGFKGKVKPNEGEEITLSFARATQLLETMAQATGGRAYFPRAAKEFPAIYREIALTLRHRYSLGFAPPVRDGRFHRIELQVVDDHGRVVSTGKGRPAYRIFARQGYIAPNP